METTLRSKCVSSYEQVDQNNTCKAYAQTVITEKYRTRTVNPTLVTRRTVTGT